MSWSDLLWILLDALLLTYWALGAFFYIFLKSRIRNPDGLITISRNSWHSKIAYPFKRYDSFPEYSDNFFSYFTKIFFMFFFGWPFLISWEAIKMTVVSPFLFLVGIYAVPDLKEMDKYENPFAFRVREFYVPTTTNGFKIFPIYILGPIFYLWLAYKWTAIVLIASCVAIIVISVLWFLGFMIDSGRAKRASDYWRQSRIKPLIERAYYLIKKYNYQLEIDQKGKN